jgi:very-short-patch-repair endonuclease
MKQVYNDALARRGMTFTQEAAVLLVLARRGRQGTTLTRRILLAYGPQHTPTRSDTETLFLELVRTYGLPDPERQVPVSGPHGFIGTVDFMWRDANVIVEVDSSWHDGPIDEDQDKERDRLLRAAGYTVKRYRYVHIVGNPGRIHRQLVAAGVGNPIPTAPRT